MSRYIKKFEAVCEITAEDAAAAFCEMNSIEQAQFFNTVANIVEDWTYPFCLQLQYITNEEGLSKKARVMMENIGNYARNT